MRPELNRITYVEDEPDIRSVAELVLTRIGGFEVDSCGSGEEALERTGDFRPDLIILDVMMPGMDGIETLAELREIRGLETTPVIFMTAKVRRDDIATYMALGAVDVIPKPFEAVTLSDTIREIWNRLPGSQ